MRKVLFLATLAFLREIFGLKQVVLIGEADAESVLVEILGGVGGVASGKDVAKIKR